MSKLINFVSHINLSLLLSFIKFASEFLTFCIFVDGGCKYLSSHASNLSFDLGTKLRTKR